MQQWIQRNHEFSSNHVKNSPAPLQPGPQDSLQGEAESCHATRSHTSTVDALPVGVDSDVEEEGSVSGQGLAEYGLDAELADSDVENDEMTDKCCDNDFFTDILEELGFHEAIHVIDDPLLEPVPDDSEISDPQYDSSNPFAPLRDEGEAIMHLIFNLGPNISTRFQRFLYWAIQRLRAYDGKLPTLYRLAAIKQALPRPKIVKRMTKSGADFHYIPPSEILKYTISRPDIFSSVMNHQLPRLDPDTIENFMETPRARSLACSFGACHAPVNGRMYFQGDVVLLRESLSDRVVAVRIAEILVDKDVTKFIAHRLKPLSCIVLPLSELPDWCSIDQFVIIESSEYRFLADAIVQPFVPVRLTHFQNVRALCSLGSRVAFPSPRPLLPCRPRGMDRYISFPTTSGSASIRNTRHVCGPKSTGLVWCWSTLVFGRTKRVGTGPSDSTFLKHGNVIWLTSHGNSTCMSLTSASFVLPRGYRAWKLRKPLLMT